MAEPGRRDGSGRRRRLLAGLVACAATALTVAALQGGPAPADVGHVPVNAASTATTFAASADTQISSIAPDNTSGSAVKMATCGAGGATCAVDGSDEKRALVKFTVSNISGAVTTAKLRFYALSTPVPAVSVRKLVDSSWTEAAATWRTSSALATGPDTFTSPAGSATGYYETDVTAAVPANGTYSFSLGNPSATSLRLATKESQTPIAPPQLVVTTDNGTPSDPIAVAAGDISTPTTDGGNKSTSDLIQSINPDYVLALGDDQYPDGALADYQSFFGPTWGRFKDKIRPAPGNHEYSTDTSAAGYFSYFGSAASPLDSGCAASCKGYYSYDVGNWHVVALNTNDNGCAYVGCQAGSAQVQWLQSDLAGTTKSCIMAYFHHPRWSSGTSHGSNPAMGDLWNTLYAAGADLVLNGHEHNYERFAKQKPDGSADVTGIREFVVGTGGNGLYPLGSPIANSQVRDSTSKGVLQLTLHSGSYDWQFRPAVGSSFTDAGTDSCN